MFAENDLWCLHVYGPDDLEAAPSKAEAERAAAHLTEYYRCEPMPISFAAEPWPHSPESHAENVKWFYVRVGLSAPDDVEHK